MAGAIIVILLIAIVLMGLRTRREKDTPIRADQSSNASQDAPDYDRPPTPETNTKNIQQENRRSDVIIPKHLPQYEGPDTVSIWEETESSDFDEPLVVGNGGTGYHRKETPPGEPERYRHTVFQIL